MSFVRNASTLVVCFLSLVNHGYCENRIPDLKGPYLGQKPPGSTAEVFTPGVVSTTGWEVSGVFTPDLREFYYIKDNKDKKQEIILIRNKNDGWYKSVLAPRVATPFVSPDGNIMHLGRRFKERTKSGWSEVKNLGAPFEKMPIMRLTASSRGTYFFDEFKRDFTGSIRYSRRVNGKYEKPKLLGKNINGGKSFHPFIAPDESYLIFDAKREGGYGDSDLYITYRQKNGSWGKVINLGEKINTKGWEAVASVTPDGKYLFFNRNKNPENHENVDILWVDAEIIETLRPRP